MGGDSEISKCTSRGINIISHYGAFGVGQHGIYLERIFSEIDISVNFIKIKSYENENTMQENINHIKSKFRYDYMFVLFGFNFNENQLISALNLGEIYIKVSLWAWELNTFPRKFLTSEVNEIWTISDFALNSINNVSNTKTINIKPPVHKIKYEIGEYGTNIKKQLKLDDKIVYLTFFDVNSCIKRKNPIDLLDIFCEKKYKDKVLIVKTKGESHITQKYKDVSCIKFITNSVEYEQLCDLYKISDVYISTATSEGQGRSIMEALQCGIKVMAVNYSAISEYYSKNNLIYIDHTEVNVDSDVYNTIIDNEKSSWAKLKKESLLENIEKLNVKQTRNIQLKQDIENRFSLLSSVNIIKKRLISLKNAYIQANIKKLNCVPNYENLIKLRPNFKELSESEIKKRFENENVIRRFSYQISQVRDHLKKQGIVIETNCKQYFDVHENNSIEITRNI